MTGFLIQKHHMKISRLILILLINSQFINYTLGQTPGTRKWSYYTGEARLIPAIDEDGTIYVHSQQGFFAINSDSTLKWNIDLPSTFFNPPSIGNNRTIYISSREYENETWKDKFYGVNPDGTVKWSKEIRGVKNLAIGKGGEIYVVVNNHTDPESDTIYALSDNGDEIWHFYPRGQVYCPPSVGIDGTVYVITVDGYLYALDPNGTLKWNIGDNEDLLMGSSPVIGPDGTIYIRGYNDFYAIKPSGQIEWKYNIDYGFGTDPVIAGDGSIYFGRDNGYLYAIANTGTEIWTRNIGNSMPILFSPAVGKDNIIYCCTKDSLYAINPDGSVKWRYSGGTGIKSPPNISSDGTIYIVEGDELKAIHSTSNGLSDGSWPKFKGDKKNSGSAYNPNCPVIAIDTTYIRIMPGDTLKLDASRSYDLNDLKIHYDWYMVKKPLNNSLQIKDPSLPVISIPMEEKDIGRYLFSVTVYDENGLSSNKSIYVDCGIYWSFNTDEEEWSRASSPAIDQHGNIYISGHPDSIYAINANGKKIESFIYENGGEGVCLSICPLGNLYCNKDNYHGILTAYSLDGPKIWEYWNESVNYSIDRNGNIYIAEYDRIYSINPDGSINWRSWPGGSDLAINSDGTLYIARYNHLYSINKDFGFHNWDVQIFSDQYYYGYHIALGPEGVIYLSRTDENELFACSPDGKTNWTYSASMAFTSSPVIGPDSTIYIGSADNNLYAINPDGTRKWTFETGMQVMSTPAVGSNGVIYFVSGDGNIYAVNPDSTQLWAISYDRNSGWSGESSPTIGPNGNVYVHAGRKLYAIYSSCKGLARTTWPKYRQNIYNTSSILDDSEQFLSSSDFALENTELSIYPNPFASFTNFRFNLTNPEIVSIQLLNCSGQTIETIVNQESYPPGEHEVQYTNENLIPGIYFCKIVTGKQCAIKKMLLLR